MSAIAGTLITDGWKEYPDQFKKWGRSFFKRLPTPTNCHLNNDKQGMQVQIVVSTFMDTENHECFLAGELKDGTWIEVHQHGLGGDINRTISNVIPRMLHTWESANNFNETN